MSTFSSFNGGSDASNYQYLHSKLIELENALKNKADITSLNTAIDNIKKAFSTETLIVTDKVTAQSLTVNAKTSTHDLDVSEAASIKSIETDDIVTKTVNATEGMETKSITATEKVDTKTVNATESTKTKAIIATERVTTPTLEATDTANINKLSVTEDTHAHDIFLGSVLDFEHFKKVGPVCGCKSHQTFVLAKVKQNKSPGMVFVSSSQDPHLKLLVQFTAESVTATYSRYSKGDVVKYIKRDLDFGDKKVTLPGIALALHETNGDTYLVLYVSVDSTDNAPGNPAILTLDIAVTNCEHATMPALTLSASNIKRLVPLRYKAGFAADNASFNNLSMFKATIEKLETKEANIVKEHVQTSNVDNATIQNAEVIKEHVQTSNVDNTTIQNAEVIKEHVQTSNVDNATITTLNVTGETTLAHTTVTGGINTDSLEAIGTVKGLALQSNVVKDNDGNVMVSSEEDKMTVGNTKETLNITSKERPTVNQNQLVAYLSDLVNSIIFQGKCNYYAERHTELPDIGSIIPLNNEGTKTTTVMNGEIALVAMPYDNAQVQIYEAKNDKWLLKITIPKGLYAYEWHIDYLKESEDKYYHEASVIWAPNSLQDIKLSIINLPLEDYYNIEQIEKIKATLNKLATAQVDWLETKSEIEVDGKTYDNPRYLRNRPVTGVSLLTGGNWSIPTGKASTVVIGGNFKEAQPNAGHAFGTVQDYFKNVIMTLLHGIESELPAAHETTAFSLKYCTDTGNLYLDTYGTDIANDKTHKIVKGNLLLATLKQHKFIENKVIKPSSENSAAINNVAVNTTEVAEDSASTNKLIVEGRRVINNEYQAINWTIQTDKRLRVRKSTANAEGDYNLVIDLYVQDILDSLQKLRTDLTTETTERKAADTQLQQNINTEKQERIAADTQLQQNINTEKQERTTAINIEAQTREQKDNELKALITASLPTGDGKITLSPSNFFPTNNSNLTAAEPIAYKYGKVIQLNIKVTKPSGADSPVFILKNIPTELAPAIDECAGIFHYNGHELLGTVTFFKSSGQYNLKAIINPDKVPTWKGYNKGNIDITYITKE